MNVKSWTTVAAIGIIGIIGNTVAYFTNTDTVMNRMTAGKVTIELLEPSYDSLTDLQKKLNPGETTAKDPFVKNTGTNSVYVFLKVTIPSADVRILKDADTITENDKEFYTLEKDAELYSLMYKNEVGKFNQDEWTKMNIDSLGSHTYLFAYTGSDSSTMKVLEVNNSTEVLFDQVKFIDNLYAWTDEERNDTIDGTKLGVDIQEQSPYIRVDAIAIQSDKITVSDTSPESVWEFLQGL